MNSGFSNFSVIVFLNFGCALLMDGFAVEYVWMLWRMPSELMMSISPGVIPTTCGWNVQPFWSMAAFFAVAWPLAPAMDATAFARPLLPPTTTFSIFASLPHCSVSLLTLSVSTWAGPLYLTSTSTVPPPCGDGGMRSDEPSRAADERHDRDPCQSLAHCSISFKRMAVARHRDLRLSHEPYRPRPREAARTTRSIATNVRSATTGGTTKRRLDWAGSSRR